MSHLTLLYVAKVRGSGRCGHGGAGDGEGADEFWGYVQINFYPGFVAEEGKADVKAVADHVEHVANVTGSRRQLSHSFPLFPFTRPFLLSFSF